MELGITKTEKMKELRKTIDGIIRDYKNRGLRQNTRNSTGLTFKLERDIITITNDDDNFNERNYRRYLVIFLNDNDPYLPASELYFLDYK
ncbi:hypothetical protein HZA33_05530 [Candidatus Pacearchaeota archaeon]|nr:hypothetical protein [Candidatus Pacearchaeota archaeon]